MKQSVLMLLMAALVLAWALPAVAQTDDAAGAAAPAAGPAVEDADGGNTLMAIAVLGACLGAGVIVIGGGISISRISAQALDSIARQPEAAGQMFLSWLIPAAMIEGAMLFGIVICLLALGG